MNVNAIFDAVIMAGKLIALEHRIAEKKAQINSVNQKRCGNCDHWMKSSCVPEKKHKQFKSMNSLSCNDFVLSWSSNMLSNEFKSELKELYNTQLQRTQKAVPLI